MSEAFQRMGAAMRGIRVAVGPMAKLQERYYSYLAHCEALGLSRDEAGAVLTGVDHVVRQIPHAMDVLNEAEHAASRLATHRAAQRLERP